MNNKDLEALRYINKLIDTERHKLHKVGIKRDSYEITMLICARNALSYKMKEEQNA